MASRGVGKASGGCRLVRDLPFQTLNRLAAILDLYDGGRAGWEQVITQMPKGTYDNIQVGTFRLAQMRLGGSPSYDLLTDMGYRGRTVEQLISYLEKVENEKALELLKPPGALTFLLSFAWHLSLRDLTFPGAIAPKGFN